VGGGGGGGAPPSNKNNIWLSGFSIAFGIVCDLKSCVKNFLSVTGENSERVAN
jgi:hypothetical protein